MSENSIKDYFEELPAPVIGRCDYPLIEIISIAICAALSGGLGRHRAVRESKEGCFIPGAQSDLLT